MRVPRLRFGHVRRWVPMLLALQLCGFAVAAAGSAPSGQVGGVPVLVRLVAVPGAAIPLLTSRRGVEETRPTADGSRGSVLRAREAGPVPSDSAVPEVPVADIPTTVVSWAAALCSVTAFARLLALPAALVDIDARGPPCGHVFVSVVPPIRSAG